MAVDMLAEFARLREALAWPIALQRTNRRRKRPAP